MKRKIRNVSLAQQLSLMTCLCLLIPMVLLSVSMIRSVRTTTLTTRQQEAQSRCSSVVSEAEQVAELCNMSTQVILNTPDLKAHLLKLKQNIQPDTLTLLEFYRQNISSLEKIVLSNPNLYQIRVYSAADNIQEMTPILYSGRRMSRMPWGEKSAISEGKWYLDYADTLLDDYPAAEHIMSLVSPITEEGDTVGVVEVSVRMDEALPELFSQGPGNYSMLCTAEGEVLVSQQEMAAPPLEAGMTVQKLNGSRVLLNCTWLKEFNCWYVQMTNLSDLDATVRGQAGLIFCALVVAFVVLALVVSWLTKRLLRGFYMTFDGIRAFANGDVDATVEVAGGGEVADFAREANGLLNKIRQLMHDNLQREMQARESEIRALQNQINAHFIYNVLEAIKMMAEIDERYDIADAVTSLGKLMRYSMKWESGNVSLERELDYIQNYIALMNLRFDYVVSLDIQIQPELLGQQLPKISLQPIVENAVVHGAAVLAADTTILVHGELDLPNGRYMIHITDEGKGMDEESLNRVRRQISGEEPSHATSGNGIGLHNVSERIVRSFGPSFGLQVSSIPGRGTTVTVVLPFHEKDGEHQ